MTTPETNLDKPWLQLDRLDRSWFQIDLNRPFFQVDRLEWFQRAFKRSSLVHQLRYVAERNHWSEERLLLTMVEALAQENEKLKENLTDYIGQYGLPTS